MRYGCLYFVHLQRETLNTRMTRVEPGLCYYTWRGFREPQVWSRGHFAPASPTRTSASPAWGRNQMASFFTCVLSIIKAREWDMVMFLLTQESLSVCQEDHNKAQSLRRIEQASACFHTSVRSSVIKMQKSLWVARMTGGMWSKPHSQSSFFVSSLFHTVPLYLLLISSKAFSSRFGEIFLLFESILFVRLKMVLRWRNEKWNDFMWCGANKRKWVVMNKGGLTENTRRTEGWSSLPKIRRIGVKH